MNATFVPKDLTVTTSNPDPKGGSFVVTNSPDATGSAYYVDEGEDLYVKVKANNGYEPTVSYTVTNAAGVATTYTAQRNSGISTDAQGNLIFHNGKLNLVQWAVLGQPFHAVSSTQALRNRLFQQFLHFQEF